jgi:chromosome segregation ATPase
MQEKTKEAFQAEFKEVGELQDAMRAAREAANAEINEKDRLLATANSELDRLRDEFAKRNWELTELKAAHADLQKRYAAFANTPEGQAQADAQRKREIAETERRIASEQEKLAKLSA